MIVQNKWNGKLYEVKNLDKKIKLRRLEDNKEIEIDRSEFNFSYRENKKTLSKK